MRALGAFLLTAPDLLLTQADVGLIAHFDGVRGLEVRPGENVQASQIVLVEVLDRVEKIAVEGHQATWTGANSLVTVRRSVNVQPCGGVIRSAWSAHSL